MSCSLTQGHTPKVCKTPSGVKRYLIAEFDKVTVGTITAGVVQTISVTSPYVFYEYKQKSEVATWGQVVTSDAKNGTYSVEQTVDLQLLGLDALTQVELGNLVKNTVIVIAEQNDGTYWLLGRDYGMDVATDTLESGVALGDFQGNKVQLKAREINRSVKVLDSIIAGLL
jgi:hypothetical protein